MDNTWRDKIHTYVQHMRQIVNSVQDLKVDIKERILRKLSEFDSEVERGRTRIEVFTDAFVAICEGISEGANALGPAAKLAERIIGALVRLKGQPPILALPSPDQFDLPSPNLLEPPVDDTSTAP